MSLRHRIARLGGTARTPLAPMAPHERSQAHLVANVEIAFCPDLIWVERRDFDAGEEGLLDYLRVREIVMWNSGQHEEAQRLHREVEERTRLEARDSEDHGLDAQARGKRQREAVARALRRLGRAPTPPRLGVPAGERGDGEDDGAHHT